ncbi:MAG: N-acetylmuramoyl-L-alanine amidase [Pseudomonadota bacterium]
MKPMMRLCGNEGFRLTLNTDTSLAAKWVPSPNFGPRPDGYKPELLVLHYTAMTCGKAAVKWLCNQESRVSSHYLIDSDGSIIQMVREDHRAWHAGISHWAGENDINSCSIGIEIQNEGHSLSILPTYPEIQMQAVVDLCLDIVKRHKIAASRVLGHSDVAFGRKIDPGEEFDWQRLYKAGVGHWVEPYPLEGDAGLDVGDTGNDVGDLQKRLCDYGYGLNITNVYDDKTKAAVMAFQQHWRQLCVNGMADMSTRKTLNDLYCNRYDV